MGSDIALPGREESNPTFPEDMGAIWGPASAFSVDLSFPISFFIGRVSHAHLTTLVLDAAARTAFPATRPEAQRRMQPRIAERRTKISACRYFFCSFEFAVRMRRANDDARRAVTTVRIRGDTAEAGEDYRPVTAILPSRRSLRVFSLKDPSTLTSTISISSVEFPEVPELKRWSSNPVFHAIQLSARRVS